MSVFSGQNSFHSPKSETSQKQEWIIYKGQLVCFLQNQTSLSSNPPLDPKLSPAGHNYLYTRFAYLPKFPTFYCMCTLGKVFFFLSFPILKLRSGICDNMLEE